MSRGLEDTDTEGFFVVNVISELTCFVYTPFGNYRSLAYQNITVCGCFYAPLEKDYRDCTVVLLFNYNNICLVV
jgi:hypothetical protein